MTIQILGGGCNNCKILEQQAKAAVTELGLNVSIEKITAFERIAQWG